MSAAIESETKPTSASDNEKPLPNSRRVYIEGKQPGVRVPFREISQNKTRNFDNTLEDNAPVRVYDTSGPWGDDTVHADVREEIGRASCRERV